MIAKLLSPFLFTLTVLLTGLGFVPTAFAVDAATVTVPGTVQVQANGATKNITGVSVSGLSGTILVAVGLSNFPVNAVLKLPTTTGLTASYGFTSGANTFASFTNISFTGDISSVNTALAAMQYVSGASGSLNPTVKVTATTSTSGYALNGYNGHFYKSSNPSANTYNGASAAAKATEYKGMPGYLTTITSSGENSFVAQNIEQAISVWIGATDNLVEGVWRWDTSGGSPEAGTIFWNGATGGSAPAGQYASWTPGSEPNNSGDEDYAVTNWNGAANGRWNDCNNSGCGANRYYVIEYGTNDADGGFVNANSDLGSGSFTLSYTPTLVGTTQNLNVTFGTAAYDTVTATNGTGTKTFTRTSNPGNTGITMNTSVTNQAVLIVVSGVPGGTYLETITATDAAGVTASYPITVTVSYPPSSDTDSAMVFNGTNQYGTASGDVTGFDITNAITIEAWIYPTGPSCNGNIVVKGLSYYLYCDLGILYYALTSTNSLSGGVSTGITIPINQWSHVAVTRVAGVNAANVYVDGNLRFTGTANQAGTSALNNSSNLFNIGARDAGANFFSGQIDEVRLWNVARSASEVKIDLKTYGGTLASGLVAYYDFNDLYGTYLVNRSTGGSGTLNLTIVNSPTISSTSIFTSTMASPYVTNIFTRTYLSASGWRVPNGITTAKVLAVGGGGAGGTANNGSGGGGGGGQVTARTNTPLSGVVTIEIGTGGLPSIPVTSSTAGGNGETTTFTPSSGSSISASGGSGGASVTTSSVGNPSTTGYNGGGGASWDAPFTNGSNGVGGTKGGNAIGDGVDANIQAGGGGGGSGAAGSNAISSNGGSGGIGISNSYIGSSTFYGGGGGGGKRTATGAAGLGGSGGGGNGGKVGNGSNATTNTGGGGGGAGGEFIGGYGGSGIIVVRYFASNPTINLQPTNDTTTAGISDSFTVGTTTLAPTFSKIVKWQVATDTVTAVASVSWIDITSGSGSTNGSGFATDTFTTSTLTTAMNKFRYRAIVTFSDSDSLTVVETSTVATLTVNPAITFVSGTGSITRKYGASGATQTVTFTGGTDTKTVSASSLSLANGKITFDTTTARFTIDTRTAVGTYLDTITITDAKGATASYVQTITFTVADTLTVTSDTPTALTFTGSPALFTESLTVNSGLVSGDVISGATYNYSSTATTCASGGTCAIGQTGPGGGLIFITPATSGNTTGRYFEAAPAGWSGPAIDPEAAFCSVASIHSGALGTAIGTGEANSNAISSDCIVSASDTVTALVLNGKDDWFMPSLNELKEMFTSLHKASPSIGGFSSANYWSSSDDATIAGYALQGWFGSSDGIAGWGITNETQSFKYRPVRSFIASSGFNYGPLTTKPTNAGTYTITPSDLAYSNGAASNYVAIAYRTSTLTINKAAQAGLVVTPLYNVFNGNPTTTTLLTTGGSDTGTVTYAYVSAGSTAGGCALSGADSSTVSVTSVGICQIVATKAATNNYLVAVSAAGTVTFYQYVSYIPAPRAAAYPVEIVLSGTTPWTNNGLAPTINSIGDFTAQSPGGVFSISGTGFVGTRLVRVAGTTAAFTVLSNTSLQITMPTGLVGISGPIYVEKAEGSRASDDWVTGTA